jgi:hypothetical protein
MNPEAKVLENCKKNASRIKRPTNLVIKSGVM